MKASIFVTDDDNAVRSAIVKRLSRRQHRIRPYESGEALLAAVEHDVPDLILLDLKMPGLSGLEVLKTLREKAPRALVILLTAYGAIEDAVEAMKHGAYDFLIKTVDLQNIDPVVDRALEFLSVQRRLAYETEHLAGRYSITNMVAESPLMRALLGQVRDVAQNAKTTVLLEGETGTGKEFLARVLHHNGVRGTGPFVGINCTAIPHELFESELFGYERGAFTGAHQRKIGLLERAEGGSLFLDEIGDLDASMQGKLLRVLQERVFRRLGGTEDIPVDFRLIAATNRDLKKHVAAGRFREDLYFRLNVVSFELPPLRKRVEDILPLCLRAVLQFSQEFGKEVVDLDEEARLVLQRYAFPGNIRELQNVIERAMIFCRGRMVTATDLPKELHEGASHVATTVVQGAAQVVRVEMTLGKQALAEVEAAVIEEVMRVAEGNKTLAAKHLGITRFALDRRLKKAEGDQDEASEGSMMG